MNRSRKYLKTALAFFGTFILWTIAVCCVDVQAIGPLESAVGFAKVNLWVHRLTGVHFTLYTITDWLGLVPIALCLCFGMLGMCQWIQRRNLRSVDRSLIALGVFYIAVAAVYLLFEAFPVNYRPVLIDGRLDTSYPSSTTMLVLCVMPTAWLQICSRIRNRALKNCLGVSIAVFCAFMVVARLISGVHWFSDIIGGMLVSAGLTQLYAAFSGLD